MLHRRRLGLMGAQHIGQLPVERQQPGGKIAIIAIRMANPVGDMGQT
jgi:hypothetical protein